MWSEHDARLMHRRRYTFRTLGEAVRGAGWSVRFCSPFNTWLFGLAVAQRALRPRADPAAAPPRMVNGILGGVFACERAALARLRPPRLPWGLSLALWAIRD
jgi:hypothetical protein